MRSLFLLGILFVLVVIAVKKPNQTAWDAAINLTNRAQQTIARSASSPGRNLPPETNTASWADIKDTVDEAVAHLEPKKPADPALDQAWPVHNQLTLPADQVDPSFVPDQIPDQDPIRNETKAKSKLDLPEFPNLPTIPVEPVEVGKLDQPKLPSLPKVRVPTSSGYADVKAFYENANRLLDEIK